VEIVAPKTLVIVLPGEIERTAAAMSAGDATKLPVLITGLPGDRSLTNAIPGRPGDRSLTTGS